MNALVKQNGLGVLIVEPDRHVRNILTYVLASEGLRTFPTQAAEEAIEFYREQHGSINLVLTDWRLRGHDGGHVLRAIRGVDPAACCCLVSGGVAVGEEEHYLRAGFDAVVRIPFRPVDLTTVVNGLLSRRETCVSALTKAQAEDLLDWLDNNGYPPAAIRYVEGSGYEVRYHPMTSR
jgi:DNA-binding response OmpR family regulator